MPIRPLDASELEWEAARKSRSRIGSIHRWTPRSALAAAFVVAVALLAHGAFFADNIDCKILLLAILTISPACLTRRFR